MNRPGADPRTEPAWLTRIKQGYTLLQQGRAEIAERVGREVLDSRPGEAVALNLVAIALNAQGRYADAAQLFAELTRVQPQERSHWGNLGTALRAAGQLQPALDAYQQAAMLGDKSANFHYNVGLLHLDRDDFDAARAMLAEAHRLAPRDAEIAYQYGVACNESTRTHEGARALANWSQFEGLTTELVAKFAVLLMNLGQTGAAEAALALARQDARPSASARLQIVLALERTNRLADARRELDALLVSSQTPQADFDVRAANGKLAQREGDHETAARVYREPA
jgi:Flp pilus assembly protein TadD